MLKRIISEEKGRMLAWTLVMFGLGSLLIPPLLGQISTISSRPALSKSA